jgi:hypothetical protein
MHTSPPSEIPPQILIPKSGSLPASSWTRLPPQIVIIRLTGSNAEVLSCFHSWLMPSFTKNVVVQPFPMPLLSSKMFPCIRATNLKGPERANALLVLEIRQSQELHMQKCFAGVPCGKRQPQSIATLPLACRVLGVSKFCEDVRHNLWADSTAAIFYLQQYMRLDLLGCICMLDL